MENTITKIKNEIFGAHSLILGSGYLSGYLSILLGFSAFIGTIGIIFPGYFITPELRDIYRENLGFIRNLIDIFGVLSILLGAVSGIIFKKKYLATIGISFACLTMFIGGGNVEVGTSEKILFPLGLDFLIIDIFKSIIIFVTLEKLFQFRKLNILRTGWTLDGFYFFLNHVLGGMILVLMNIIIHKYLGFLIYDGVVGFFMSIPIVLEVLIIFVVTDFFQYWIHRAYHEVGFLWKLHAVHHSAPIMDWLAGSRLHFGELFTTRASIILVISLCGFSQEAINIYVVIVSLWATFIHMNINIKLNIPYLNKIFVGPKFHHWHHSTDQEAINKNYAGQIALYDYIFGTALDKETFPEAYGILSPKNFPKTFIKQLLYPFKIEKKSH